MRLCFKFTVVAVAMSLSGIFSARDVHAAVIYDLKSDWSDASNPNGVWSYNEGNNALPHVVAWEQADIGDVQPAWADSGVTSSHQFIPAWFKSVANFTFTHDWQTGDVVVHTTDFVNGVGNGRANVNWTSPLNGTVNVSGAVWMGRDVFRGNQWTLSLNGVPLTGGNIFSGDPFNRTSPFNFAAGSGGSAVLNNVPVSVGDVLALQFVKTSEAGDFVGVNLTIAAIPEPSSLALCAIAVAALGIGLYRKNSKRTLR